MSAYIVHPRTMNQVVTYIVSNSSAFGDFKDIGLDTPGDLGQAFYIMNADAVEERYGDREPVPLFSYRPEVVSKVQVFKAMRNLLYQCTEGAVPESNLFKLLDSLSREVAMYAVYECEEFAAASWSYQ